MHKKFIEGILYTVDRDPIPSKNTKTTSVTTLAIDTTETILVVGCDDGRACVIRTSDGTILRYLNKHKMSINDVCIHPSNETCATVGMDMHICVWHLPSGQHARYFSPTKSCVLSADFYNPGQVHVIGDRRGNVAFVDVASEESVIVDVEGSVIDIAVDNASENVYVCRDMKPALMLNRDGDIVQEMEFEADCVCILDDSVLFGMQNSVINAEGEIVAEFESKVKKLCVYNNNYAVLCKDTSVYLSDQDIIVTDAHNSVIRAHDIAVASNRVYLATESGVVRFDID
ncbi:hypothetical protein PCE1_002591 [Barthelona sp. PCE]